MDSYAWVEVRDQGATGGRPFWNAHYYWPAVSDPSIVDGVLHGDWHSIDYLAVTPSIEADLGARDLALLPEALQNADEVRTFFSDYWKVRILRVRKLKEKAVPDDPFLTDAWATYKDRFIQDGRVVDPATGLTTSEAQSYALLRAVYLDDRTTFDQLWAWTRANLQMRRGDALLVWEWGMNSAGATGVLHSSSAADADEDTALALLFAGRRWDVPEYQAEAVRMLESVWDVETTTVGDRRVVVAGDWARRNQGSGPEPAIINPSYFAPYAYRIFAEADPSHSWQDLVDSTYDVLARVRAAHEFGGSAGVVPDWISLDPATGEPGPADSMGPNWSQFSYDASRLPWRLALDWLWFQDERSKEALGGLDLPRREVDASDRLAAAYMLDGTPAVEHESLSMYAGTLGGLLAAQDRGLAHRVFAEKILHSYQNEAGLAYWGDINAYYDQNWAWFATALMDGGMANLWAGQTVLNWDQVLP
jgi:endoglucanase